MTEAQLRTVVEEVVKALAAKDFLKAAKCECENGPKALNHRGKAVLASGDVRFLNRDQAIFRRIEHQFFVVLAF